MVSTPAHVSRFSIQIVQNVRGPTPITGEGPCLDLPEPTIQLPLVVNDCSWECPGRAWFNFNFVIPVFLGGRGCPRRGGGGSSRGDGGRRRRRQCCGGRATEFHLSVPVFLGGRGCPRRGGGRGDGGSDRGVGLQR